MVDGGSKGERNPSTWAGESSCIALRLAVDLPGMRSAIAKDIPTFKVSGVAEG